MPNKYNVRYVLVVLYKKVIEKYPGTQSSSVADLGCLSRVWIFSIVDTDSFPSRIRILDPGVKKHRIPDPDPQHCYVVMLTAKLVFRSLFRK
jgi:hypothetical protein